MWGAIARGLKSIASSGELLKGVGAVANAWGSYDVGKRANKIAKEQLQYDRQRLAAQDRRRDKAQAELDIAVGDIYGQTKKKKNKKDDLSLAFAYQEDT